MTWKNGLAGVLVVGLLLSIWACAQEKEPEAAKPAIFVKTTELAKVAFTSYQGSYDNISKVMEELLKWTKEKGYTVAGPPRGIFFDDPSKVPPEELKWEIEWAIVEDVKEMAPEKKGGVGIRVVEPMEVATTYHKGPFDKVGDTWKVLFGWVFKNNYQVAGAAREIWWSDPDKVPEADLLTELQVPVKK